jgi:uncharacterized delta-60 repeat protein
MRPILPFALAMVTLCLVGVAQPPVIRFETLGGWPQAKENVGLLAIGVLRDGALDSTSKVRYLFLDADKNRIVPVAGQLVFAPGEHRQVITVPVLDNTVVEGESVFAGTLILRDVEGASFPDDERFPGETIRDLESQVLITDNEFGRAGLGAPPAEFFPATPAVMLDIKMAELSLRRLGESSQALTVNFATADQTAKAGVHYVAQTSVVTFAPLETEKTVTVPLLPGLVRDREVALELVLSGVEAGKAWTNRTTLRVVDTTRPGTLDLTFDAGELEGQLSLNGDTSHIEDLALLPDGRLHIGGHLNSVQGIPRDGIARLLPDGRLDPSFREHSPEFALGGDIHRLHLLPDGRLLAGWNGDRSFLPDGTGDVSWEGRERNVSVFALLPDGKLLGTTGESPGLLSRLNPDGSLDPSFKAAVEWDGRGLSSLVEPDGRIVVSARLQAGQGDSLVRLLSDGWLDSSFAALTISDAGGVAAVARQVDGRYLVASSVYTTEDQLVTKLVRLHSDGTTDPSFKVGADLFLPGEPGDFYGHDLIRALVLQPDGKILVGGRFGNPRSISHGGLLRLNADGSLDSSFEVGSGVSTTRSPFQGRNEIVKRILLQPDGQILVAGYFTEFDGFPRAHLIRVNGDGQALRLGSPTITSKGMIAIPVFTGGRSPETIEIHATTQLSPPNWSPIPVVWDAAHSSVAIAHEAALESPRFFRAVGR